MVKSGEDVNSDEALKSLLDLANRAVPPAAPMPVPRSWRLRMSMLLGSLAIVLVLLIPECSPGI